MEVLLKRLVEGMGTKVQYKSYLPGYYASRDLNEDGWPPYYEDAMAGGQLYGTYPQRLVNGYTDYDKEALKRTMLNQEAMFRNQVHELHRLYRRQRELMEEFKLKEPCHYALQSMLSLPSSSSHNKFTMDRERIPSVPWPWDINCNLRSQSGSGGETLEPLKTLNNESGQASVMLTESGDSLKKSNLDSNLSRRPRVASDLQLPADVYIDSENEKTDQGQGGFSFFGVAEYPSRNCNPQPGKDLKLGLGCNGNPSQGESWQGILRLQDAQRSQNFSDLNSPISINGICHGASPTFLSNCLRGKAPLEETQGHQSSLPLQSSLLKMKNFQDLHKGAGSSLLDQQRFANQSERNSRFLSPLPDKTMLEPHRSGQCKVEESCDLPPFLASKHMKMEAGCKEKLAGNSELFGTCIGGTSYSALSSSTPAGPSALVPLSGRLGVPSPSRSSQKKPMDGTPFAPIDIETIPLFNESALLNHASISSKSVFSSGCVSEKFPLNKSLTSNQSFGSEASSYPNGFLHNLSHLSCQSTLPINFCSATHNYGGIPAQSSSIYGPKESFLRLDNKDVKPLKNLDLNLDLSTDCPDVFPSQQEMVSGEPESKNSKTSGGLPWFRSSPSSKESIINLNITVGPDDLSSQDFDRREQERNPSSDASRTPAKSPKPTDCSSGKNVLAVDTIYPDGLTSEPSCRNNIIDLEKPAPMQPSLEDIQNDVSSPKVRINLNFMPTNTRRSSLQIDLEAPAISDMDDDALCCKETLELDQFFTPAETRKNGIVAKAETERQHDGATSAAEIIVAISSSMCRDNLDSVGVEPLDTSCTESLTWFADVVCSSADEKGNLHGMPNEGVGNEDLDSEDVDLFEFMTLKLAETRPEDHWINHKPPKRDDTNSEEAGFASLLVGKPKRGQARKRRQKRDFQKDILPGLASLSRQEATEDLQTIGGLLRACGQPWEMGLARRNANRSGTLRSRGGRRARGGASATTRTKASSLSPTKLPNNTEVVINGTNMVGWGRTRRCRRARCPSGNVVLPLLPKE